jgi:hypothetical protein
MSFDIFFQPARYTGVPVVKKNPWTGEDVTVVPSEAISAAEERAVREVLKKGNTKWEDQGCCVIEFDDGGTAEILAKDLTSGCMVALRGITPDVSQFLFDLLKAGNWVMLPAMQDAVAITSSPGSVKGVPNDFPRLVTCNSANEIAVLLREGIGGWQEYRDQIVRGGE